MKNLIINAVLLFVINISLFSQNKTIYFYKTKYKLKYANHKLNTIIEINKRNRKKNNKRQVYHIEVTWKEGQVRLIKSINDFAYTSYEFKFDTLRRIYEIKMHSEWSNHVCDEYYARKFFYIIGYSFEDKHFHFYRLNYPYEVEIDNRQGIHSDISSVILPEVGNEIYKPDYSPVKYEFNFEEGQNEFKKFIE